MVGGPRVRLLGHLVVRRLDSDALLGCVFVFLHRASPVVSRQGRTPVTGTGCCSGDDARASRVFSQVLGSGRRRGSRFTEHSHDGAGDWECPDVATRGRPLLSRGPFASLVRPLRLDTVPSSWPASREVVARHLLAEVPGHGGAWEISRGARNPREPGCARASVPVEPAAESRVPYVWRSSRPGSVRRLATRRLAGAPVSEIARRSRFVGGRHSPHASACSGPARCPRPGARGPRPCSGSG